MWGRHRVRAILVPLLLALPAVALPAGGIGGATAVAAGQAASRITYSGGGEVYLVDQNQGSVQWLDRVTLQRRGDAEHLGPIGRPVVDPSGVLWAPLAGSGKVVGIHRADRTAPIEVGEDGQTLRLTLAGGRVAATDVGAGTVTVVENGGASFSIPLVLDKANSESVSGDVKVPASTESSLIPLHDVGKSTLHIVDLMSRKALRYSFGTMTGTWAEPQAVRNKVYLVRESTPRVIRECQFSISRASAPQPVVSTGFCPRILDDELNKYAHISGPMPIYMGRILGYFQYRYSPFRSGDED